MVMAKIVHRPQGTWILTFFNLCCDLCWFFNQPLILCVRSHCSKCETCVRFSIFTLATKNAAECNNNSTSLGSLWENLHTYETSVYCHLTARPYIPEVAILCLWYTEPGNLSGIYLPICASNIRDAHNILIRFVCSADLPLQALIFRMCFAVGPSLAV